MMTLQAALAEVTHELTRAMTKHPARTDSPRHHHSVLEEEFDEFWDAIKADDFEGARKEAVQVAAMAIRYLMEAKP